jgi:protein O-GlcNAc transferase
MLKTNQAAKRATANANRSMLVDVLGNTYLMAQRHEEAITTLSKVLEMKPNHVDARDRLRAATARKHLLPKLEQYKRQVAEKPDNADAHSQLASAYNSLGMFAEAEVEYLKAIELDPKNGNFYNLLAIDYSEWGKLDKAIEYYKKAIDLKPQHVLYFSLGTAYGRQGNLAEAVKAYQESIKIKPTFTYALYSLALIYSKQDRYQDSIELLRKVVELEPRHIFAQHALGMVYIQTGEKTGAMQQYYLLKNLDSNLAADLLARIPK